MPEHLPHDPATERALRDALDAHGSRVRPGPVPRVSELLDRAPARRWPTAFAAAAAVVVVAAATAVALDVDVSEAPVAAPTASTVTDAAPEPSADPSTVVVRPTPSAAATTDEPTGEPTTAPPGPQGQDERLVVWYAVPDLVADAPELEMVPERRLAPLPEGGTDTERRVSAALTTLVSGPPADPDHSTGWWWEPSQPGEPAPYDGSSPVGVSIGADGTTVDLPAAATGAPLGSYGTPSAVQQLVRTVSSNGGPLPVTVLVDGRPGRDLWGAVVLEEPVGVSTAPGSALTGGWILDPYEGQRVPAGSLTVSGTATAFEGTVTWLVTSPDGMVVAEGFTSAGANGEYGPFQFTVDLSPGPYVITVREDSAASPGEGVPVLWQETRSVVVTD